jgi:hypothetical protein
MIWRIIGSCTLAVAFVAIVFLANRASLAYSCGYLDAQRDIIINMRTALKNNDNVDFIPMPQCEISRSLAEHLGFKRLK